MTLEFFFKGMLIGFAIAAPLGPIGVLCIRLSLAHGMRIGLAAGVGAAAADALYGAVGAFGLTAISNFLLNQQRVIMIAGGIFLCYLGLRTFVGTPAAEGRQKHHAKLANAFASTWALTLSNPTTILSFIAVFAGFGLVSSPNYRTATSLVAGVFLGSALWWLILGSGVALIRKTLRPSWMNTINRLSGCLLFAFGAFALWNAMRG